MACGFAHQSGGGLVIESAPGRGTTVTLWFHEASDVSAASASVVHKTIVGAGALGGVGERPPL